MIHRAVIELALAIVVLPTLLSAEDKLEAVWSGKLRVAEFRDEQLGISLEVTERAEKDRKGGQWGSGRQDTIEKDGKTFGAWIRESNERTMVCSVPLEKDVIWKLIRDASVPPEFRFVAITNVHELKVDKDTMAKMLEEAVSVPDAWVRGHAWRRVFWFPDREKVAHLLPKAIMDPCLDNAHRAIPVLCKHLNLLNEDGTPIELVESRGGLIHYWYRARHKEVEFVAERLREQYPKLISPADIKSIQGARVPPEEWFRRNFNRGRPEDVSFYLEPYQTKKPNKAQQDKPQ